MLKLLRDNASQGGGDEVSVCNPIIEIIQSKDDTWILYEYLYKPPRSLNKGIKIEAV